MIVSTAALFLLCGQSYKHNIFRPHHTTPLLHNVVNQVLSPPSDSNYFFCSFLSLGLTSASPFPFVSFAFTTSSPSSPRLLHLPPRSLLSSVSHSTANLTTQGDTRVQNTFADRSKLRLHHENSYESPFSSLLHCICLY